MINLEGHSVNIAHIVRLAGLLDEHGHPIGTTVFTTAGVVVLSMPHEQVLAAIVAATPEPPLSFWHGLREAAVSLLTALGWTPPSA